MKTSKKVLFISIGVILLLLVAFFGYVTYRTSDSVKQSSDNKPLFGIEPYIVESESMIPTMNKNDIVFMKKVDSIDDIKAGEIYVYNTEFYGQKYKVIHRALKINENGTITLRGDANIVDDDPVRFENIEGSYVFKISGLANVTKFIQKNIVSISIGIIIISILIIYIAVKNILVNKKSVKKNNDNVDSINKDKQTDVPVQNVTKDEDISIQNEEPVVEIKNNDTVVNEQKDIEVEEVVIDNNIEIIEEVIESNANIIVEEFDEHVEIEDVKVIELIDIDLLLPKPIEVKQTNEVIEENKLSRSKPKIIGAINQVPKFFNFNSEIKTTHNAPKVVKPKEKD